MKNVIVKGFHNVRPWRCRGWHEFYNGSVTSNCGRAKLRITREQALKGNNAASFKTLQRCDFCDQARRRK